jgi:hypothetical protein
MAIIALLVSHFQSFASLHLYWVWALLVHPTPKNPKFAKSVHHIYLLASLLSQVIPHASSSFQIKMLVMRKLVSKALTNLMAHFIFLHIINLNHCDYLVRLYACQIMSWELAQPCCHGARFQHCTYSYLVDIMFFCYGCLVVWNKMETCKLMELVYVLEKRLSR